MLDLPALRFLHSESGTALLTEAAAQSGELLTRITRLRRRFPTSPTRDHIADALELLRLRERARSKFTKADRLFFTPEGLEQASGETIAQWRAAQFPADVSVLDFCCGNGGDALAFGANHAVTAFDRDPAAAYCARVNADLSGQAERVQIVCADVTRLPLSRYGKPAHALFWDPARRREGRRFRDGEQYAPPLSFLETLRAAFSFLAVKVSPALEDATLEAFVWVHGGTVTWVSERGECKEAVCWFGEDTPPAARRAVLLPQGVSLSEDREAPRPPVTEPQEWLYEPDAAVVRAHLIAETAAPLGAAQLDAQIAYLTASHRVPTPFATAYQVVEWMPFHLKRVQARLRETGRRVVAIKRRGVPLEPESLRDRLTGAGDRPTVVVLTRVHGSPAAILCEPPVRPSHTVSSH